MDIGISEVGVSKFSLFLGDTVSKVGQKLLPTSDFFYSPTQLLILSQRQIEKLRKNGFPPMLRKGPATLLILVCLITIAFLGALNGVTGHYNSFPLDNKIVVGVIRYLPTAMLVSFGFAWRCLIQDLKIITPYSVLSTGWSEAPNSLLLDYVDPIESN